MASLTTDYVTDRGDPEPYLRAIAAAGFSHVHWCHEWNTDTLYPDEEIRRIGAWLTECGLGLLDLHASAGVDAVWTSESDDVRAAGVCLVTNRIRMASCLGADTIVLHIPAGRAGAGVAATLDAARRSLDELRTTATHSGIRIAFENMPGDNFVLIGDLFAAYGPEYVGLCYDSGHGALGGHGLRHLERLKDRLLAVHLHDNDGAADRHDLPFTGVVDWNRLARVLAQSAYRKCMSLESNMRGGVSGAEEEAAFLQRAVGAAQRLESMVCRARGGPADHPGISGEAGPDSGAAR